MPRSAKALRELLGSGTHAVPGVFNAAVGLVAERAGFPAVYVSGAATANGVAGLPDVGLLSLEEVVLRIRAILRRSTGGARREDVIRYADLELDAAAHEVRRAGVPVDLSPTEFKLLEYLLTNAGRVVSKAQILDNVWRYDFDGDASIVESYVYYLRKKIDKAEPQLIHTVRGVGYTLRIPR